MAPKASPTSKTCSTPPVAGLAGTASEAALLTPLPAAWRTAPGLSEAAKPFPQPYWPLGHLPSTIRNPGRHATPFKGRSMRHSNQMHQLLESEIAASMRPPLPRVASFAMADPRDTEAVMRQSRWPYHAFGPKISTRYGVTEGSAAHSTAMLRVNAARRRPNTRTDDSRATARKSLLAAIQMRNTCRQDPVNSMGNHGWIIDTIFQSRVLDHHQCGGWPWNPYFSLPIVVRFNIQRRGACRTILRFAPSRMGRIVAL